MSNYSSADHILDNLDRGSSYDTQFRRLAEAQAFATLALVEAQQTANLIALLEWSEGRLDLVSYGEYIKVVKQVKERIK